MRLCPVCSKPMRARQVHQIEVDGCEECGGVWFDHQELTELAKSDLTALSLVDAEFRPAAQHAQGPIMSRRCPGCSISLEPRELRHAPGVAVDMCPRCHGQWLEDTELTTIQGLVSQPRRAAEE